MTIDTKIIDQINKFVESSIKNEKIASIEIESIVQLSGDASSRRYYRLTGKNGESYVVCLDPSIAEMTTFPFVDVQKALTRAKVRVPIVYDYDADLGHCLQEDLKNKTLLSQLGEMNSLSEELVIYKSILGQLFLIHNVNTEIYPQEDFAKLRFDKEKLMYEVQFTITHLLKGFLLWNDSRSERIIIEEYEKICTELASQSMVLTHRDFHSRNIMMDGGQPVVIDFQDARLGLPQYDLVSLLDDCYYRIDPSNVQQLKEYYYENMKEHRSVQASYDEFEYFYNLMALQRTFKALGSFGYLSAEKGKKQFIENIGYAFENLKGHLYKFPKFKNLRKVLSGIYYER